MVDDSKEQNGPPVIQEEAVRELLRSLDVHKSMGPDVTHHRVMRELADEFVVKLLSIIYQQSWLTGEVPDDWKLAQCDSHSQKGWEGVSWYISNKRLGKIPFRKDLEDLEDMEKAEYSTTFLPQSSSASAPATLPKLKEIRTGTGKMKNCPLQF
ncbi:hypothetical protein TURU_004324 [Turdus rufiventris]|nr:hypothetical protein TURU_004324 [Turdus rufiventris]